MDTRKTCVGKEREAGASDTVHKMSAIRRRPVCAFRQSKREVETGSGNASGLASILLYRPTR